MLTLESNFNSYMLHHYRKTLYGSNKHKCFIYVNAKAAYVAATYIHIFVCLLFLRILQNLTGVYFIPFFIYAQTKGNIESAIPLHLKDDVKI